MSGVWRGVLFALLVSGLAQCGFAARGQDARAGVELDRLVKQLTDARVSRAESLRGFQRYVERFPKAYNIGFARDTVSVLQGMVQEPPAMPLETLGRLPLQERIAALIQKLEGSPGHEEGWPITYYPNWRPTDEEAPKYELAEIGYPALPQLIKALDDRRFTRSRRAGRFYFAGSQVARVRQVSAEIIAGIACRSFHLSFVSPSRDSGQSLWSRESDDGAFQPWADRIRAWWSVASTKTELENLSEGVEAADINAPFQGGRLVAAYPNAALEPIEKGIEASKDEWVTCGLLQELGSLNDPARIPLARKELAESRSEAVRLRAIGVLAGANSDEAVQLLVAEVGKGVISAKDRSGGILLELLNGSGDPRAVTAQERILPNLSMADKFNVVQEADAAGNDPDSFSTFRRNKPLPGFEEAEEELLASELTDTQRAFGLDLPMGNDRYRDPRMCDVAMRALNWLDKTEYPFRHTYSLAQLDRQRYADLNVWRRKKGLAPLSALVVGAESGVNRVTITGDVAAAPDVAEACQKFGDRVLTSEGVRALFPMPSKWPTGLRTLRLVAYRDAGRTGFDVELQVNPAADGTFSPVGDSAFNRWVIRAEVAVNGHDLSAATWLSDSHPYFDRGLREALTAALAAPKSKPIYLHLSMTNEERPPLVTVRG